MNFKRFLPLIIFLSASIFAGSGGCGGHGGDSYSLEFYRIGKYLSSEFNTLSKEELLQIDSSFNASLFETAVEKTRIVSFDEELILNDREVDAINRVVDGKAEIQINRARWDSHKDLGNRRKRIGIVLHEYLGVMKGLFGIGEWDNYKMANKLLAIYDEKLEKHQFSNKVLISKIINEFKNSSIVSERDLLSARSWSCLEVSALDGDISLYSRKDAYIIKKSSDTLVNYGTWSTGNKFESSNRSLTREWVDLDPSSTDPEKETIKEYLRINEKGDLVVQVTTSYNYKNQMSAEEDKSRGVLSYLYCSRFGSKLNLMLRLMKESLTPILEVSEQQDFHDYINDHKKLKESSAYKSCINKNKDSSCQKVGRKLDKLKLKSETDAVSNAKRNITQINDWMDSLDGVEDDLARKQINELFNFYVKEQEYLKDILDIGDRDKFLGTFTGESLKHFIEVISERLPVAYKESKSSFIRKYESLDKEVIESFGSID